jgi:hypothetical protein
LCSHPPSTVICPICGGHHTEDAHGTNCPNCSSHSHAGQCDCPLTCFLCRTAKLPGKNHSARDASCPLWKCFRPAPSFSDDELPPADSDIVMTKCPHPLVALPTPPSRQDLLPFTQTDITPAPAVQPKEDGTGAPSQSFSVADPRNPTMDELLYLTSNPDAMAMFQDTLQSLKSTSP